MNKWEYKIGIHAQKCIVEEIVEMKINDSVIVFVILCAHANFAIYAWYANDMFN